MPFNRKRINSNKGLTLVEMLVVVGILALVSTLAVRYSEDLGDRASRKFTEDQFDAIRQAVLNYDLKKGGYLQDMGWPPLSAQDLLKPAWLDDDTKLQYDETWETFYGWSGAYLDSQKNDEIKDAWNTAIEFNYKTIKNDDKSERLEILDTNKKSFTFWSQQFTNLVEKGSATEQELLNSVYADWSPQSLGRDKKQDGTGIDSDIPARSLLRKSDWLVDISQWRITIENNSEQSLVNCRLMVVVPFWTKKTDENTFEADLAYYPKSNLTAVDCLGHLSDAITQIGANEIRTISFGDPNNILLEDSQKLVPAGVRKLFLVKEVNNQLVPVIVNGQKIFVEMNISNKTAIRHYKLIITGSEDS